MPTRALLDLIVIRHGETEANARGIWQGPTDSPLTARGRAQARAVGAMLARMGIGPGTHRLLSSPQPRALATARLAFAAEPETDERLREIGIGAWAGRPVAELRAGLPTEADLVALYDAAPGGEGTRALAARVDGLLADLAGPAILVTHGMTGRMIRARARGLAVAALPGLPPGQGRAVRVTRAGETVLRP